MRWVTYHSPLCDAPSVGLVDGQEVIGLGVPSRLIDHIAEPTGLLRLEQTVRQTGAERLALADVILLAPVPVPPSVRDFMAFEEHLVASTVKYDLPINPGWYDEPCFYFSNPAAIQGPYDDVAISPGSAAFDFELEIAAIIGKPGRDIAPDAAEGHIAGYAVLADWSARDLQRRDIAQGLGPVKGKDSATSLGPMLVTPDEIAGYRRDNGFDLTMTASIDGREVSRGNWSSIYWSFAEMIAFASRGTELRTGDVLGSGTVGTGCLLEHDLGWLRSGQQVELSVEVLGTLSCRIVEGASPIPLRPPRNAGGRP